MKNMMKKVFALAAVIAVLTTGSASVFAEYDPNRPIDPSAGITATKSAEGSTAITVNGTLLEGAETYVDENGEIMLPIRAVAETLGFEVGWNAGRVTLTNLPVYVTFSIGTDGYTFAKTAPVQLGKAPELKDEKTYVPSAFFSEILEAEIKTNLGGTTIVYGETQEEESAVGTAVIKSIEKDEASKAIFVLIEDEEKGEIQLNIGEETEIVKDGEKASAEDLKEGMKLSVEYGEAMTMSLPPQNNPIKLVIATEEADAKEETGEVKNIGTAVVKSVEKDEEINAIFVLIEDEEKGEVQLNIGEETEIVKGEEKLSAEDLQEGMKLSVEYGEAMTKSLPPQNTPVKIVVAE